MQAKYLALTVAALLAAASAQNFITSPNLIVNGGCEDGPTLAASIQGWTNDPDPQYSGMKSIPYGFERPTNTLWPVSTTPGAGQGNNFCSGHDVTGANPTSRGFQEFPLTEYADAIDAGNTRCSFSATMGGTDAQDDRAGIDVLFYDAADQVIGQVSIGPVTAAMRGYVSKFIPQTNSVIMPVGARKARVQYSATAAVIPRNQGYFDDLTFTLSYPGISDDSLCVASCLHYLCTPGTTQNVFVEGTTTGNQAWGTSIYSEDSVVALAATHAGLVQPGERKQVTVSCRGNATEFTGSAKNGVTTQSYTGTYRSFHFEGDTSVPPPPVPTPEATPQPPTAPQVPEECDGGACALSRCTVPGTVLTFSVTGSLSGAAWGTQTYTDDSHLGAVAVHAGVLAAGETGTIIVQCASAAPSYVGSLSNEVQTGSWGAWPFAFTITNGATPPPPVPEDTCNKCLDKRCGTAGQNITVSVLGATFGTVWGVDVYTEDSDVSIAAVHAGLVAVGERKTLTVTCQGPQTSFEGNTRNLVQTFPYGAWGGSFTFGSAPPPAPAPACNDRCMHNQCASPGTEVIWSVTGKATGDAWGVDTYTDDSDLQLAAVHAGLIAVGETATIRARCAGAAASWPGSTRFGVTTQAYASFWGFSYVLEKVNP